MAGGMGLRILCVPHTELGIDWLVCSKEMQEDCAESWSSFYSEGKHNLVQMPHLPVGT